MRKINKIINTVRIMFLILLCTFLSTGVSYSEIKTIKNSDDASCISYLKAKTLRPLMTFSRESNGQGSRRLGDAVNHERLDELRSIISDIGIAAELSTRQLQGLLEYRGNLKASTVANKILRGVPLQKGQAARIAEVSNTVRGVTVAETEPVTAVPIEQAHYAFPGPDPKSPTLTVHPTLSNRMSDVVRVIRFIELFQRTAGATPLASEVMGGVTIVLSYDNNPESPDPALISGPGVTKMFQPSPLGGITNARSVVFPNARNNQPVALVILGPHALASDSELLIALGHEILGAVPEVVRNMKQRLTGQITEYPPVEAIEIVAHRENVKYLNLLQRDSKFQQDFPEVAAALPSLIEREERVGVNWGNLMTLRNQV